MNIRQFTDEFIQEYLVAFTEMKRLGLLAGERHAQGKTTDAIDAKMRRIYFALKALSNSENLTSKQIEALEFSLISYNENIVVPSVPDIVDVTLLPQFYTFIPRVGQYTLNGQDLSFKRNLVVQLEVGSFVRTGQDVNLSKGGSYEFTPDYGSFIHAGQDVTLTFTPTNLLISSSLSSSNSGSIFTSTFDSGIDSQMLSVQGASDNDSGALRYQSSVTVVVQKTTNGGVASYSGGILYIKNSILVHTTIFSLGDPVNDSYEFTGLASTDTLEITILEEG